MIWPGPLRIVPLGTFLRPHCDGMLILSVFADQLLLSNNTGFNQLFTYNFQGLHRSTITIRENNMLYAATWTYRANIILLQLTLGKWC